MKYVQTQTHFQCIAVSRVRRGCGWLLDTPPLSVGHKYKGHWHSEDLAIGWGLYNDYYYKPLECVAQYFICGAKLLHFTESLNNDSYELVISNVFGAWTDTSLQLSYYEEFGIIITFFNRTSWSILQGSDAIFLCVYSTLQNIVKHRWHVWCHAPSGTLATQHRPGHSRVGGAALRTPPPVSWGGHLGEGRRGSCCGVMAHCPGPGPCCAARAVQASPPLLLSKTTEEKASAGCGWAGADWRLCWDGTVHWARQQCNVWAATHSQPANQPGHLPTLLSISTLLPRVCCWGWPCTV